MIPNVSCYGMPCQFLSADNECLKNPWSKENALDLKNWLRGNYLGKYSTIQNTVTAPIMDAASIQKLLFGPWDYHIKST